MTIRTYRAGSSVEDYCRACKTDRIHTVIVADANGQPLRAQCGYCRSEHNYRGGPRVEAAAAGPDNSARLARAGRSVEMPRPARQAGPSAAPMSLVSDKERA